MKKFATLLAILGIVAGTWAAEFGRAGDGRAADFATSLCAWFIVLNNNGLDGCPLTSHAPGQGDPASPTQTVVLHPTRNLGHGVYAGERGLVLVDADIRNEIVS